MRTPISLTLALLTSFVTLAGCDDDNDPSADAGPPADLAPLSDQDRSAQHRSRHGW